MRGLSSGYIVVQFAVSEEEMSARWIFHAGVGMG